MTNKKLCPLISIAIWLSIVLRVLYAHSITLDKRDELLDALYAELEQNMQLLGATAINDKLQDGVPHTIAQLLDAGIRFWVLTGDKQGLFAFVSIKVAW